jgi:hypothetical protein
VLAALGARLVACLQIEKNGGGLVTLSDGSLEFTALLRIPENSTERVLGWKLRDDDNAGATVSKVRAGGSVAKWNKANPRLQVKPGDKIIKVNNIPWHNNTQLFMKHMGSQIRAASKRVDGAPHRLYVKIQRPATKVPETQLADGSLEFTALLRIPKGSKDSQSKLMGWQLDSADDTVPATIGKIRKSGAIAKWNEENPTHKIMPGDKIIKVNTLPWHNNTKLFIDHLGHRVKAAIKRQEGAEHHLYVKIQRGAADSKADKDSEDSEEDAKEGKEGDEDSSEDMDKDDSDDQDDSKK